MGVERKESWNVAFNMVMNIKDKVTDKGGDILAKDFKDWVEEVGTDRQKAIFERVGVTQDGNLALFRYEDISPYITKISENGETETVSVWVEYEELREMRSIVIDLIKEKLVSTPYRKFFNFNELEESSYEAVADTITSDFEYEIVDKLDGSMQHAVYYDGEVKLFGSRALNADNSWRVEKGMQLLKKQMLMDFIKENAKYTMIFEYISKENYHVVDYSDEDEGLYLIGMRDLETGRELSYGSLHRIAKAWGVKHLLLENIDFNEIMEHKDMYQGTEKEGWVINVMGTRYKLKCDDYVELHRLIWGVNSTNVIIKNIVEGTLDDVTAQLPKTAKEEVIKTANKIYEVRDNLDKEVKRLFEEAPKDSRKEFMIWVDDNVPKDLKGYVRNKYLGRDYNVLKTGGRLKRYNEIVLDV